MYQIVSLDEDELLCRRLGKYPCNFNELQRNWSKIGIYQKGALSSEVEKIAKKDVKGKVLQVENFLITCPSNILREQ